jgi:hypothetical protein
MEDRTEPPVLADLMALKVNGPALVFIRPQRRLPDDELRRAADSFKNMRRDGHFAAFPHLKFVIIPSDFDIMAVGDVELERLGLTRLPTPEKA